MRIISWFMKNWRIGRSIKDKEIRLIQRRIDKNEIVNDLDEDILEALRLEEKYNESMHLVKDLKGFLGEVPREEVNFIVMHVCTLLAQA